MGQFEDKQFQDRIDAVRAEFSRWHVDGILIGSTANRRWLSGFTGSAGWILVTEEANILGTDFRYWEQAREQSPDFELRNFREGSPEAWQPLLDFNIPVRLGIEAQHMTLAQFRELNGANNVTFVELGQVVEKFREVKNDQEMEIIRKAVAITDAVMEDVNCLAKVGIEERQLAWELERRMREHGASGMAFPIIVAFGENGAMAHHQPGDRALQVGDPVIVDMGAKVDGYTSDLTRSFFIGSEPSTRYLEVYKLVLAAQEAALAGMRAGMSGREVDSLSRDKIIDGGYGEAFGHSLGHGLGLEVHEGPTMSRMYGTTPMQSGSVVTVEPGIYLPGWGGVRIEDVVRITEEGVEVISQCPKSPIIDAV